MITRLKTHCWCGNSDLTPFSSDYLYCSKCHCLALMHMPEHNISHIEDKNTDLYGKQYYLSHLPQDYGYPDLPTRARTDLPERCLHWLRTLLKYKLPPAKALELGSAHGGFVAMLNWAGFDTAGLELSPWVVDFAKKTFNVHSFLGPIEDQKIEPSSLDVIVLMDVLEHLPDPVASMRQCLSLLRPDGLILIQTPKFPEDKSYECMKEEGASFLLQLKEAEHVYLFSEHSIRQFFSSLGAEYLEFESAIFAHYDMFLVASRERLVLTAPEKRKEALTATPGGRLIQALIDIDEQKDAMQEHSELLEADRAARLEVIHDLGSKLQESEADRAERLEVIHDLERKMQELATRIDSLMGSSSWRITAPLRWIIDHFRKMFIN